MLQRLTKVGGRRVLASAQRRKFTMGTTAAPVRVQSWFETMFDKPGEPQARLDEVVPCAPVASTPTAPTQLQVTTLSNGLRVASVDANSPTTAVGVFIDAGSRHETSQNQGISHFLEQAAFTGTAKKSDFGLVRDMMSTGNSMSCTTSRDATVYLGECLRENGAGLVATLADVINNSQYHELDLAEARARYEDNLAEIESSEQVQIMENVYAAGYFNNTLGRAMFAPRENLATFTADALHEHTSKFFVPSRMVLTAVGMEHAELAELGESLFHANSAGPVPEEKARYTGGEVKIDRRGAESDGMFHVALAFEAPSWHHKDLVPACVLQMMMGGGSSFSAGGPGKGMYSRMYENVLNQHGWVESATCFNSIFSDSSMFGIYGTAAPERATDLMNVLGEQFQGMTKGVSQEEMNRAKNGLKSAVRMQLENRSARLEDIGRQLLTYKSVRSSDEICKEIDAVTEADLKRAAENMLKTPLSIAARGNTSYMGKI